MGTKFEHIQIKSKDKFEEFVPMYDSVCAYSNYIDTWFHRNAGVLKLEKYLSLIKHFL